MPHPVNTPHAPSSERVTPLVTINLDTEIGNWGYDPETGEPTGSGSTIADAIVDQAARMLVSKLEPAVTKAVIAQANEEIVSQVQTLVSDVLTGSFRVTDRWGSSTGETTIRERIAEQIAFELKPREDRYGSDSSKSVITKAIEKEVREALTADLRGVISAARDKVVTAVRDEAATLIAKAVRDGLR